MLDWVIVDTLENGETAVSTKRGYVELMSYSDATTIVSHFVPSIQAYSPNGAFVAPVQEYLEESWEADSPPLRIVERRAIPSTDYNPKNHDTFHLRLGPYWREKLEDGKKAIAKWGLVANLEYPGSALDVMNNLLKLARRPASGGTGNPEEIARLLEQAHPIVWSPQMVASSTEAAEQLQDSLTVETDVMFLNPMFWLYCTPQIWKGKAKFLVLPVTKDGHIPMPEEDAWDMEEFGVARLIYLSGEGAIEIFNFSLVWQDSKWVVAVYYDRMPVGSQPAQPLLQFKLKLLRFAASPYLIVKRHKAVRATARRVGGKFPVASEGVGVILLRRAQYQYPSREHGEGAPVPWSCQWWVSGHWKRQWHPSTKTHKLTYIMPYMSTSWLR